ADIQQALIADQPHPEGVARHQGVPQLLGPQLGMPGEEPIDVAAGLTNQVGVDDVAEQDVAVTVVLRFDLLWIGWVVGLLIHRNSLFRSRYYLEVSQILIGRTAKLSALSKFDKHRSYW